ncbi:MAG TPA: DUF4256 domain-containing protein [Spirochaetales bacterium]|nr:DUF4256 domain-containing protein [Spirochaetales bacterium]
MEHTATDQKLLAVLQQRFETSMHRHKGIMWDYVLQRLALQPEKRATLVYMEESGGQPDVIAIDGQGGQLVFCDCSVQSPAGRRSFCYDKPALDARKSAKPANSALEAAASVGAELLNEEWYHRLQALEPVDTKTSSWLRTPTDVRALGGAIFGDRRYGRVFVYHNSAESYYAARGFRCMVRV